MVPQAFVYERKSTSRSLRRCAVMFSFSDRRWASATWLTEALCGFCFAFDQTSALQAHLMHLMSVWVFEAARTGLKMCGCCYGMKRTKSKEGKKGGEK
jgi:hypothetical protein